VRQGVGFPASDDRRLDPLATVAADALHVEDGDRQNLCAVELRDL
jgi:hypothetical protein